MRFLLLAIFMATIFSTPANADSPVVLELFTSQGCSSCPPADALLQTLSGNPKILALSFHVNYWDSPEWRDPFSSAASTQRQVLYKRAFRQSNLYTPELVIDGGKGMVGSRGGEIADEIRAAVEQAKPVIVTVASSADQKHLSIDLAGNMPEAGKKAGVWLIGFSPKAVTAVRGGENGGRQLTSINNVNGIRRIGEFSAASPARLEADVNALPGEGYAVLVQMTDSGKIIGAGSYLSPSS